ncbi:MAG: hypothetical protein ACFFCV_07200 [Promethearchaeota archaeon]
MFQIAEDNLEKKKRGHRPKKFENPSKVISFRADKEKYEQNKDLFRTRIESTIKEVTEEINSNKVNKQKGSITKYFNKKEESPKKQTIKRKISPSLRSKKEFTKVDFDLDGELREYPTLSQNDKHKELEDKNLEKFYDKNQKEIKEKVKQFIEEQDKHEQEKEMSKEEIFNEFEEVIDVDIDEFKER